MEKTKFRFPTCSKCDREYGTREQLEVHEMFCKGKSGVKK